MKTGLSPALNRLPKDVRHIHLMGICGTGMASMAGILKNEGYIITGSDEHVYPPMSDFLEGLGIQILEGYGPQNLYPHPDLVIVGNVITKHNPEAVALADTKINYLSFPQALKEFALRDKSSVVIAGTHGKTTTSSLAAWITESAGMDPGFMIGGIPLNFRSSFKLGKGKYFIVEGDEYDTAFFDKGPKFLHYKPLITLLTSIEFDHADIYRDLDHVIESFRKLIDLMPDGGLIIANGDDPIITAEIKRAKCPFVTYGFSPGSLWQAVDINFQGALTTLKILKGGKYYMRLSTHLYGRHNISNLLGCIALGDYLAIPSGILLKAVQDFRGVRRRQEKIGEKHNIIIIDDFAHHPTAVRETIIAVKEKFSKHRLIALFEPRSNSSRRKVFQEKYASSFDQADMVMIPRPTMIEKIPSEERFSSERLVEDLKKKHVNASFYENTEALLSALIKKALPGDVILIMSNGAFDNIHKKLLEQL